MKQGRHHLWTWLSISLYGGMVLAIQAFHTHDGDGCGSCCVLGTDDYGNLACRQPRAPIADGEEDEQPGRPFTPHEDDCPACQFVTQPKTLAQVVTPPDAGELTEILSSTRYEIRVTPAWRTPHLRGPPAN